MIPLADSLPEGSIETVQQEGHDLMASVTAVEAVVEPWQKLPLVNLRSRRSSRLRRLIVTCDERRFKTIVSSSSRFGRRTIIVVMPISFVVCCLLVQIGLVVRHETLNKHGARQPVRGTLHPLATPTRIYFNPWIKFNPCTVHVVCLFGQSPIRIYINPWIKFNPCTVHVVCLFGISH
jgi:hypothetical protein